MALEKENDNLMGVDTTTYNRIKNTSAILNGHKSLTLVCQKYSSQDYRKENPNDFKPFNQDIKLTDEEYNTVMNVMYTALKREIEGEDC